MAGASESLTSWLTGLLGRECVSQAEEPSSQTSPDLQLCLFFCKVLCGQDGGYPPLVAESFVSQVPRIPLT